MLQLSPFEWRAVANVVMKFLLQRTLRSSLTILLALMLPKSIASIVVITKMRKSKKFVPRTSISVITSNQRVIVVSILIIAVAEVGINHA
jgi:hypothetical protein